VSASDDDDSDGMGTETGGMNTDGGSDPTGGGDPTDGGDEPTDDGDPTGDGDDSTGDETGPEVDPGDLDEVAGDPIACDQADIDDTFRNGDATVQPATAQVLLANGLTTTYLTRTAGNATDQMVFWPHGSATPTHLMTCVEGGAEVIDATAGTQNPSVQRISLADGSVETILRGLEACDGLRTTAWGTLLATEEEGVDGAVYEILDPLNVNDYSVTRGGAGENATITTANGGSGSANVVKRVALATMAWEGFYVNDDGMVIGGDELRPGSYADARNDNPDTDGGAIIKFIPTTPFAGGGPITDLADSPLVAGNNYALRVECEDDGSQQGQGCEIGSGTWIPVGAVTARVDADQGQAAGFYRPEDLHEDPNFAGPGFRICWTNTGNAGGRNFGEVMCAIDSQPLVGGIAALNSVVINRFLEGDPDFTQPDNFEFQPNSPNAYVIEDNPNGDIWACLPDGNDRDIKTDGCVKMLSVVDASAEPTGFVFAPDGRTAYVSIQHSSDCGIATFGNYATDDILVVTGFADPNTTAIASFGAAQEDALVADSVDLLGIGGELPTSSTDQDALRINTFGDLDGDESIDFPSDGVTYFGLPASSGAFDVIDLAPGLSAEFLTRTVANDADQLSFFPLEAPTHIIACIESRQDGDPDVDGDEGINPAVQRIDLTTGAVETILIGLERCDGIRTTPWGTVLATEEAGDGAAYEILDPLATTEVSVQRGGAGQNATFTNAAGEPVVGQVAKRIELPTMAWEGLDVLPSGVVIAGDELRPGSYEYEFSPTFNDPDTDGGSIFKFIPENPLTPGGSITDLDDSPFVSGTTYALQVSCNGITSALQAGQGCEIGNAGWVALTDPVLAREEAYAVGATGFYRPEDLHFDPNFDIEGSIRFCWTNTGNGSVSNWSEVVCGVDSDPDGIGVLGGGATSTLPVVINRFVEGDTDFNSADNLDFQPDGHTYVIEDNSHGDVWACLNDGADRDIKTDGCIRILSVEDPAAEPTGFFFGPDGTEAFVVIQHSADSENPDLNFNNFPTDDLIRITGFTPPDLNQDFGLVRQTALAAASQQLFGFGTPLVDSASQP